MANKFNPLDIENKPKVVLYSYPKNPLEAIANCYHMIEHEEVIDDLVNVPKDVVESQVLNGKSTLLQVPFEMQYYYFIVYNVPRIFTHQLCENKFGSYKQQSMRFISKVWDNFKYSLPSSIRENKKAVKIVEDYMDFSKDKYEMLFEIERDSKIKSCTDDLFNQFDVLKNLSSEKRELQKLMFNTPIAKLEEKSTDFFYSITKKLLKDKLIVNKAQDENWNVVINSKEFLDRRFVEVVKQSWTQIQDARELLPRNVNTLINVWMSLRAILGLASQYGKSEYWIEFFEEFKKELRKKSEPKIAEWIEEAQAKAKNPSKTLYSNISVSESPIPVNPVIKLEDNLSSEYTVKRMERIAKLNNKSIMDLLREEWQTGWIHLDSTWFDFEAEWIQESISHQLIRHRVWSAFKIPEISVNQPINEPLKFYDFIERDTADFRWGIITKKHKEIIKMVIKKAQDVRIALVNMWIPLEDANHILPILVTNNFKFSWNLRTLMMVAAERISTQASFFWSPLMKQIKESIQSLSPAWKEMASLFLPAWVLWGRNPFQAVFDRKEQYKPEEIFNLWEAYSRKNYLLFKKQYWEIFFDEFTKEDEIELENLSK